MIHKNSLFNIANSVLKYFFRFLAILLLLIFLYLLMALAGTLIRTKGEKPKNTSGKIVVFVQSNGLHTDIIVPLKNASIDWLSRFGEKSFENYQEHYYIAFGWGDRDFYIESKTSPSFYTSFKAIFLPSESLMHVAFYKNIPKSGERSISLHISFSQYRKLIKFIENQFIKDKKGNFILIDSGYGAKDYFFESKGFYHLFNTCNNWTNRTLKSMQIQTGIWTPFSECVLYHLK